MYCSIIVDGLCISHVCTIKEIRKALSALRTFELYLRNVDQRWDTQMSKNLCMASHNCVLRIEQVENIN